ncbi:phenylacetate-CoA oxygenase [Paraburkholderia tropica]|nr:phenylacetate-CoA oxygenase [Paraburkholderia tropica]
MRPDGFFGVGQERQKYQESHTKVSQVFEAIQIPVSFE